MQDVQFNRLIDLAVPTLPQLRPPTKQKIKEKIKSIAVKNNKALADLPYYERTPTEDELETFRAWSEWYKKVTPRASKREVRKATQEHFHIRIYK